jgi:signal transduction histidine kinase
MRIVGKSSTPWGLGRRIAGVAKIRRHLLSREAKDGRPAKRLEGNRARAPQPGVRDYQRLQRECRQWKEKFRAASHQLLSARDEERKRISRELHDVVAQALAGISSRLAALQADAAGHGGNLAEDIAGAQRLVEKSIELIHRFARELRPTELDDLGLIRALHGYMTGLRRKTGLPMTMKVAAAVERLDTATQTALYRVAQEALTNVVRHAQAGEIEVTLQKFRRHVALRIRDDGSGFRPGRGRAAGRAGRLGLLGMKERLEMVGGTLSIKSTPGKGTTVLARVPLPATARSVRARRDGP